MSDGNLAVWFNVARDLAQIAFWFTIATIAILTYHRAKKSLLQPAKTEVFKLQVARLKEFLEEFSWLNTAEAWEESGLAECLGQNSKSMLLSFLETEHNLAVEADRIVDNRPVGSFFTKTWAEKNLSDIVPGQVFQGHTTKAKDQNWFDYEHGKIDFFKKFAAVSAKLKSFASDPLVPTEIAEKIEELYGTHQASLSKVGDLLTDLAKVMPEHYDTVEKLDEVNLGWIANAYEGKDDVFNALVEIRKAIRAYLSTDELLKFT